MCAFKNPDLTGASLLAKYIPRLAAPLCDFIVAEANLTTAELNLFAKSISFEVIFIIFNQLKYPSKPHNSILSAFL